MRFARTATWGAAIGGLLAKGDTTVALSEVLQQRKALVDFTACAHQHLSLADLLAEAAKCTAVGCKAPMVKVLELQPGDDTLILKAHWGLHPGLLGSSVGPIEPDNPPAQALMTARPAVAQVHTWDPERVPAILREFSVASSINVPLISRDGPYGVLEVDYTEPHEPGALELSYLGAVATIIADYIERARETQSLISDLELKVVLLREQQHRVRNNFQTIISLLQLNEQLTRDADAKRRFAAVTRRMFALVTLYDHLLGAADQGSEVPLGEYMNALCADFAEFYDLAGLGIGLKLELDPSIKVGPDTCTGLGTVLNELLANAVEHAFVDGPGAIEVALSSGEADSFVLEVRDNGKGYGETARDNTGMQTARRLVTSIGGSLQRIPAPDRGTIWRISMTRDG